MSLTNDKEIMMLLLSDIESKYVLYPNIELLSAYRSIIEHKFTYMRSSHVYPDVVSKFDEVISKLEKRLISILDGGKYHE